MKFERNYDKFEEQEGFSQVLPEDDYMLEIAEVRDDYTAKNNDYMACVTFRVIDDGKYYGTLIWDNIIFPTPDSPANKIIGRTKRFLHCIDEPYQGDFDVDTDNWIGKTVQAHTGQTSWEGKKKTVISRYLLNENKEQAQNNKQPFVKKQQSLVPSNINKNSTIDDDDDLPF